MAGTQKMALVAAVVESHILLELLRGTLVVALEMEAQDA